MKKIRWAIAGPGCIAHKFAEAIKNVECAELIGVASRTGNNTEEFARLYEIDRVFPSYEEMAECKDIDAIYVSTAHPFHKSCSEIFLNCGKHVLCEKPLCVNASQAQSLKQCATKNNVFLMEAMWTRFIPATLEVLNLVHSGIIGEVLEIKADFCYRSSPEEEAKLFLNELAGGALLDVGVYGLHYASLFFGNNPKEISAVSVTRENVDTRTNVILKYDGDKVASVSSAIELYKPESAYVYGEKGYIHIPEFYGAKEFYVQTEGKTEHFSRPYKGNGFEEEIYEACQCIMSGKTQSDILPLSESIAILKQMDKIRKQIGIKYPLEGEF